MAIESDQRLTMLRKDRLKMNSHSQSNWNVNLQQEKER